MKTRLLAMVGILCLSLLMPSRTFLSAAQTPSDSSTREIIVFACGSWHATDDTEIYMIKPDGSNLTRLTNNDYVDWGPRLSPDGTKMVFYSRPPSGPTCSIMDLTTKRTTSLDIVEACAGPASWSPDGTKLAFGGDIDGTGSKLHILEIATGNIIEIPSTWVADRNPDWSPDGSQIAAVWAPEDYPRGLYTLDVSGTGRLQLNSRVARMPDWSPDGMRIVYEEYMGHLRIINADGSNDTAIPTAMLAFAPRWSPDGTQILYSTLWGGVARIINADGSNDHVIPNVTCGWISHVDWGVVRPTLTATVELKPDTLNLKNQGKWITAYTELPEGHDVVNIDVSTVMLEDIIPAENHPTAIGDYDKDGIPDLMVKFDRQALINHLNGTTGEVSLTVSGNLNDGTPFKGSDTITVINPGRKK